jgi:hypothetical protein
MKKASAAFALGLFAAGTLVGCSGNAGVIPPTQSPRTSDAAPILNPATYRAVCRDGHSFTVVAISYHEALALAAITCVLHGGEAHVAAQS